MFVVVSWDWLTVLVSFWAAVFGGFASIEVISHLLQIVVQRKLETRKNVFTKNVNGETHGSQQQSSVVGELVVPTNKTFVEEMSDTNLILFNVFIAAVALGACGIWAMHFIGIYSLSFFIIPDGQAGNEQAIINQGYFNNPSYAPLHLNIVYTLASLVVAILSVFFGLCTAAWAFGLFRPTLSLNLKEKEIEEPKSPIAMAETDNDSMIRDIKLDHSFTTSKDNRIIDGMPTDASKETKTVTPPRLGEIRNKPNKLLRRPSVLKKLMQKLKAENDALKYLRDFTFFSLSIRDRIIFVLGGVLTGLGVAGMHYSGMAALRVENVKLGMDPLYLAISIVIASVVSTVALWILFFLRSRHAVFVSSLVMGLAVCAMHYTASAGLLPEYVQGYNTVISGMEVSGFDTELLSAHLAFSFELGIINYVHRYLK